MTALHIAKEYETGVGHIEWRAPKAKEMSACSYLVSFYKGGGRVSQTGTDTLEEARFALRRLAA